MQREHVSIPKMIFYFLFILIFYALQTSIFGQWSLGGYHIDLLPAMVASAAMLGGPTEGMIVGLLVGILYDLSYISIDGLYPIYFLLFGLLAGVICRLALSESYISLVLLNTLEMLVLSLLRYFCYLLPQKGASLGLVLQQTAGGVILSGLFCFAPYVPMSILSHTFDSR